jgi:hypothetical protein
MKDLKVGFSLEAKMLPADPANPSLPVTIGFKAQLGGVPHFQAPLSPITMTRDIFSLPP